MGAPPTIAAVLGASPLVHHWIWCDRVDSTQRLAIEEAASAGGGLVVLADHQMAGRGREGRTWFSPGALGLWLSIVLEPSQPPDQWPVLTSLAALALRQALARAAGLAAGIKWPNDVCWGGRKIAGVLADTARGPRGQQVVLGLGLNVGQGPRDFPDDLRSTATSVKMASGRQLGRAELLEALLESLDCRLQRFEQEGAAALRPELREAALLLDRTVRVRSTGGGIVTGRMEDVGPLGEMVLRIATGGCETISGGTVLDVDPPLAAKG